MRVDLSGSHVLVAEQFLYRSDVVAGFQQVRCEAVTERVASRRLGDIRTTHGDLDGALQHAFIQVMTPFDAIAWVDTALACRKHVLPRPIARRVGILSR